MRNYILVILAVLAGALAFFLAKAQLQKEYQRLQLQAKKIKVIAPTHDLVEGDVVQPNDLTTRFIFASDATGEEITLPDVKDIIGQKLAFNVRKMVPLRWRDFEMQQMGLGGSYLARTITKKERALAVAVDATSSVAGMIRPNDHVDIIGTFRFPAERGDPALDTVTLTLLQNVTVLAVGQQLSSGLEGQGARQRSYSSITLSVTPKEAEMLVFAQQKGKLTFTLRHPRDVYIERDIQSVNFQYLEDHLPDYLEERAQRLPVVVEEP